MRTWRFVTLTLVALTLGMSFAHVLELGPKMGYPAPPATPRSSLPRSRCC